MNKLAGNNSTFVFCDIVESVEIDSIRITERSGKKLLDQSDVYLFIHSCILDKITEVELIDKLQNEFNLNLDDYKVNTKLIPIKIDKKIHEYISKSNLLDNFTCEIDSYFSLK